ncbi:hypothetical protein J0A68_09830 [Algoriphagus sp. H41]|uniref:DUF2489 domain-containing protein n=1 Tax=Algoriphagus oliviformis TaxID=2811231 RepID=A0ABS3C2B4_9BACT|nr:hypothetical protein [Algoriphagus oliviformis]MBN7811257.1 hypothetical protein [Algoriphagus oliviformis]
MNEYESERREKLIRDLVSNSRRILSNEIGFPLGIHIMAKIFRWINDIEPLDFHAEDFFEYENQLDDYPLGTDRLKYNIDVLIHYEDRISELNEVYRSKLMRLSKDVIDKYGA